MTEKVRLLLDKQVDVAVEAILAEMTSEEIADMTEAEMAAIAERIGLDLVPPR